MFYDNSDFSKTGPNLLVSMFYWTVGGMIWGVVELIVALPLHPWVLSDTIKYMPGLVIYPLAGLAGGVICGVLVFLWSRLRSGSISKVDCFYGAANIAFIVFVRSTTWTFEVFNIYELFEKSKLLHLSHIAGMFFVCYMLARPVYGFFVKHKEKGRFFTSFIVLSALLYTFIALEMYWYDQIAGFFGVEGLKYLIGSMVCALLAGTFFYNILLLFTGANLTKKLAAGLVVGVLIISAIIFFPKISRRLNQNPYVETAGGLSLKLINKQEVISKNRPNIVLITPDTLRGDHLSCYGYDKISTRFVDSLAEEGVLFENAISTSPWTLPSFASLFTSLYPTVHGAGREVSFAVHTGIREGVVRLAEVLKEVGYHTRALSQSWFLGEDFGFRHGFDYYNNMWRGLEDIRAREISKRKKAFLWSYLVDPGKKISKSIAQATTDEIIDWLEVNDQYPFFLWVHYLDPHFPYKRVKNYNLDTNYKGKLTDDLVGNMDFFQLRTGAYRLNQDDKKYFEVLYDEEILYIDESIGRILDKLKQINQTDNTLFVFTSDHGEEFWEHGRFGHGIGMHQEVINVPLIMKLPGILPSGARINQHVSLVDVMPTILDILGVKHKIKLEGESLLPLINGDQTSDRAVFNELPKFFENRKSITKNNYKLIYFPSSKNAELFDLEKDPHEMKNIYHENQEIGLSLKQEILAWIKDSEEKALRMDKIEKSAQIKPDDEAKERLRSLGYIN